MSRRVIVALKVLLHLALLSPFASLLYYYHSGWLALQADPVNIITHFTGDWALWILLASLAITPLRRISPRLAVLVRFRRMVGLYGFFYATLHLATYVFLFSGYDLAATITQTRAGHPGEILNQWRATWPTIWDDLKKRRFIQVGFLSWLILFALTLTSPQAVLRRMGGKIWARLHRLVYVAAIAAVVHYWWLVKAGNRAPWKVTAILAVLLLARLGYSWYKRRRVVSGTPSRDSIVSMP